MVRAPRAPFLFLRPTRASGVRNRTVYECVEITAAATPRDLKTGRFLYLEV